MRNQNQKLRDALFTLADARGNNPHGTREDAVHEGRRLNAMRYETVGQIDRALDARVARSQRAARARVASLAGAVADTTTGARVHASAPSTSGGATFLEAAFLLALGAGVAYLMTRPDDEDDESVVDDVTKDIATDVAVGALTNPAPAPTAPIVVVVPTQQPAPPSVVPVVVPPPPVEEKVKSKRKKG